MYKNFTFQFVVFMGDGSAQVYNVPMRAKFWRGVCFYFPDDEPLQARALKCLQVLGGVCVLVMKYKGGDMFRPVGAFRGGSDACCLWLASARSRSCSDELESLFNSAACIIRSARGRRVLPDVSQIVPYGFLSFVDDLPAFSAGSPRPAAAPAVAVAAAGHVVSRPAAAGPAFVPAIENPVSVFIS